MSCYTLEATRRLGAVCAGNWSRGRDGTHYKRTDLSGSKPITEAMRKYCTNTQECHSNEVAVPPYRHQCCEVCVPLYVCVMIVSLWTQLLTQSNHISVKHYHSCYLLIYAHNFTLSWSAIECKMQHQLHQLSLRPSSHLHMSVLGTRLANLLSRIRRYT